MKEIRIHEQNTDLRNSRYCFHASIRSSMSKDTNYRFTRATGAIYMSSHVSIVVEKVSRYCNHVLSASVIVFVVCEYGLNYSDI